MMPAFAIRPFTANDYPAMAAIASAAIPEDPISAAEMEFGDKSRDPKCRHARWIMEKDGAAVGYGLYCQNASMYHPRKFSVTVNVHPNFQGQGLGKLLYEQVMAGLTEFDPLSVRVQTREDMSRSVRFLQERGFVEDMREFESHLDVATFDFTPYADAEKRITAHGIEIKTLRALQDLPGHWDKHYALSQMLNADVPSPEPYTPVAKDLWRQRQRDNPNFLPDAYFFAVKDGDYIGISTLGSSQGNTDLHTGLTGVRREWRRHGIALALKLRAIAWAKTNGCPLIKTWNESNNRAMLGINEQLGFVRQPAWLDMVKVLKEDDQPNSN